MSADQRSTPEEEIYLHLQKRAGELAVLAAEIRSCAGSDACVLPSGHPLAGIFLVKDGVSDAEREYGVAFAGPAQDAMMRTADRLGILLSEFYGTTIRKCGSCEDPEKCLRFIAYELAVIDPSIIIAFGTESGDAIASLFALERVEDGWTVSGATSILFVGDLEIMLHDDEHKHRLWEFLREIPSRYFRR